MPGIFRSTSRIDQRSSADPLEGGRAVLGASPRVAVLLEPARERLADDLLVVDDQDRGSVLTHGRDLLAMRELRVADAAVRGRSVRALASTSTRLADAGHHAAGRVAVHEPEGVAELVERLLQRAATQQARRAGSRVSGTRPRGGDHRGPAAQLRLAEDEGQDRDEQVDVGQAESFRRRRAASRAATGGSRSRSAAGGAGRRVLGRSGLQQRRADRELALALRAVDDVDRAARRRPPPPRSTRGTRAHARRRPRS